MTDDPLLLLDRARALALDLERAVPGATTELEAFPSGAFMLDVRHQGRYFVLAYIRSSSWFGVDEVEDGDGFGDDHRFGSQSFDEAARELERLVTAAPQPG